MVWELALPGHWIDVVWIRIVSLWMGFDPCEYGSQQDRDECEERGCSAKF
jgi:hypothetical protein